MILNLQRHLRGLLKGGFVKNVGVLVGGTAFAQLIALLVLPILTRLYSPEDFGVLAVYTSVLALISVVACLRFEIAIPMPKDDQEAAALFVLALGSVVLITILSSIGVWVFSDQLAAATEGKLSGYTWLIPIGVFFAGLYAALQYWATRNKVFPLVAKTRMTQAISSSSTQLGMGFLGAAPFGLLLGQLLSVGAGIIGLGKYFLQGSISLVQALSMSQLKDTFKKYDRFPKYSTLEAFANTGGIQIPIILIAYYAAGAEAGFLMLAMRLLSAPMGLIGGAVAQVYLSEAAEKHHQGQLKAFTYKAIWGLAKVGFVPLLLAGVLAPYIIPLIFGEGWQRVGVLIAWMVPWFFMQFITSPVSMALHITGHQKIAFVLQLFGLLIRVGVVVVVGRLTVGKVGEFYAISGVFFYTVYLVVILFLLKQASGNNKV